VSTYVHPSKEKFDRMANTLKPVDDSQIVTGTYKDDDSEYSLENLLKKQEGGVFQ
jgi:hypothetical protein